MFLVIDENMRLCLLMNGPIITGLFLFFCRPFERTLTLHKDSAGQLGFQFKEGKITAIAVNSSSARNGLLIEHNLLEVTTCLEGRVYIIEKLF